MQMIKSTDKKQQWSAEMQISNDKIRNNQTKAFVIVLVEK